MSSTVWLGSALRGPSEGEFTTGMSNVGWTPRPSEVLRKSQTDGASILQFFHRPLIAVTAKNETARLP